MRNEQRAYGQKRSQAQNSVYADVQARNAVYRLRKGEERKPEQFADGNEKIVPRTPLTRTEAHVYQPLQRVRSFKRSREPLGGTQFKRNDNDDRLHALL